MTRFSPNCAITSVGSLPHLDPPEACRLILEYCKEAPAWPQLPNLGFKQSMYVQYAYDFPDIVMDEEKEQIYVDIERLEAAHLEEFLQKVQKEELDEFSYGEDYFMGLFEMLEQAKDSPDIRILKGQVTGPISLGLKLTDQKKMSIIYDETLNQILTQHLRMKAKWQQRALAEVFPQTLIVFDEPYMNMFGSAFLNLGGEDVLRMIAEVTDGVPGLLGLHCCGNTDWGLMMDTGVDVISLDAYNAGDVLALYSDKVREFLSRGGILAWGIVPSVPSAFLEESQESLLKRLEKTMGLLIKKDIEEDVLLNQSLITPSCGLVGMEEGMAENALAVTKWISDSLRKKHNLED
ncbi:MAG: hypothetical protein E3J35_00475 [Methanomassiliicoccales archaeon]|nr:MAG: hypothetical protein E3J35_00475 [Methanomassiliicoccales archaeon]